MRHMKARSRPMRSRVVQRPRGHRCRVGGLLSRGGDGASGIAAGSELFSTAPQIFDRKDRKGFPGWLWRFDQLHFSVSGAMEDHHLTLGIAKNEYVAVAEMGFLDGFFKGHGTGGDGLVGANQVNFGGLGDAWELMNQNGDGGRFRRSHGRLQAIVGAFAVPLFMLVALLAAPARFIFYGLLFEMLEGFVDGDAHVIGLRHANQRSVTRTDGNFGFVAVLLDRKDHLGIEFISEDLADFSEAGFSRLADGGSNFVVPAG